VASTFILSLLAFTLACALVVQARVFSKREDKYRAREDELRNQLWELAGGKKPVLKIEREKIVKVADPDAPDQTMNTWDLAMFHDDIKEELEQIHPAARAMSVSQVKAKYPHDWKQIEAAIRAERAPLRAS
jgi:hypothetical protein